MLQEVLSDATAENQGLILMALTLHKTGLNPFDVIVDAVSFNQRPIWPYETIVATNLCTSQM